MGTYKSKGVIRDIEKMPPLDEEPEYEVKTKGPLVSSWKLNILRGKRESDL